jgi:hypothetical protein
LFRCPCEEPARAPEIAYEKHNPDHQDADESCKDPSEWFVTLDLTDSLGDEEQGIERH